MAVPRDVMTVQPDKRHRPEKHIALVDADMKIHAYDHLDVYIYAAAELLKDLPRYQLQYHVLTSITPPQAF